MSGSAVFYYSDQWSVVSMCLALVAAGMLTLTLSGTFDCAQDDELGR